MCLLDFRSRSILTLCRRFVGPVTRTFYPVGLTALMDAGRSPPKTSNTFTSSTCSRSNYARSDATLTKGPRPADNRPRIFNPAQVLALYGYNPCPPFYIGVKKKRFSIQENRVSYFNILFIFLTKCNKANSWKPFTKTFVIFERK